MKRITQLGALFLLYLCVGMASAQCTASDSFSGSTLSGNWTQTTATSGPYLFISPLIVSGGNVTPTTSGTQGAAFWTGSTCSPNQTASVVLNTAPTIYATGPGVRGAVAGNGYVYMVALGGIYSLAGMHLLNQVAENCNGYASGHTYTIAARGNYIYGYDNGTLVCQGQDGVYPTGQPFIAVDWGQATTGSVSTFSAGLASILPPTFSYPTGTYAFSPVVSISNPNGSTLCVTTDGSTPSTSSPGHCGGGTTFTYTTPITVSTTTTLTAIATEVGGTNSGSSSIVITIRGGGPVTWYVDQVNGGTRYSAGNRQDGQCDGLSPNSAASQGIITSAFWQPSTVYHLGDIIFAQQFPFGPSSGSSFYWTVTTAGTSGTTNLNFFAGSPVTESTGVVWTQGAASLANQHCAFNDVRYLWTDGTDNTGSPFPAWGWVGAGGDTYIVKGAISDGVTYRVGWDNGSTYCNSFNCFGITSSPNAGQPSPPSGGPSNHTQIFGGNHGSCAAQNSRTQLHGGFSASNIFGLGGASYVDLACFDLTDFSQCGLANQPIACTLPAQDFARIGINFSNSSDITLTDIRIHGMADSGINGPTQDSFVGTRVDILGNASSGWNADNGDGKTGWGSFMMQNFNISWNGCAEQYPIVDSLPYVGCTDQSTGGYGDGFGTSTVGSPPPGWQVHFDQGTSSYNTQDGLDALHISGAGSSVAHTRVLAYGNEGQQLKVGGATATIQNSVIVGNCAALTNTIPGRPVPTGDNLADICRAGNTAVLINVTPSLPAKFQFNTLFTGGSVGLEVEYALGFPQTTDTLLYNNNIFLGAAGVLPQPLFSSIDLNMLTNPGASWTNNSTFGQKVSWTCPQSGESAASCGDPLLADETYPAYGFVNMAPASGSSPVVGAGTPIGGITVDLIGASRANPPTIGACETTATCPGASTPSPGGISISGTVMSQGTVK